MGRVQVGRGGKSAGVILDEAGPGRVIPALLPMALMVNGQACIAQTRVLVPRSREQEFTDALAAALQGQTVGDPVVPDTTIGPLVCQRPLHRGEGYPEVGRQVRARVEIYGV